MLSRNWKLMLGLPVVAALFLGGAAFADGHAKKSKADKTIVDVAVENGQFTTLVAALKAAGLVETLQGEGPFTVFAPTDDAFAKLPEGTVEALLEDKAKLTSILTYHVVAGAVKAADVVKLEEAKTVQGASVRIDATDGVKINDSKVVLADVMASNGVIHVIDAVLLPPMGDGSKAEKPMKTGKTIVDIAVENGNFTTLVTALKAAGLVETLQGDGPFTVFAPNDDAFAKLPKGTVESLLKNEKKLTSILTYHVVAGKVTAADVSKLTEAKTLQGQTVTVDARDGVMINSSKVIAADIMGSNGIIHVIDSVLLPPAPGKAKGKAKGEDETSMRFPRVTGDNLNGKTYSLPGDLEGEKNLVIVAFHRSQQSDVDTWLPAAGELEERVDGFRYYEIPTIGKGYKVMRSWIDGGMRRGIPDVAQRGRTITLYIDKAPFKAELGIERENQIVAMLVNQGGEILWRAEGRRTADKMAGLEKALGCEGSGGCGDSYGSEKGTVARAAVRQVFERAIERGAPMYNHGNVDACVGIYEVAIESVLALADGLPAETRTDLEAGLRKARHTHDRSDRAWVLRAAMDEVYETMATTF